MRHCVWVVMSLLGWRGPADVVPWIAGDDSRVGDACALLFDCDSCAPDFDDGPAYGLAGLVVKDDCVSGADLQAAVALVSVGVSSRRFVLALMLGQLLLVPEGSSYRSAVSVDVGFLLALSVGWP